MSGTISRVRVKLNHIQHTAAIDLDVLLQGPSGQNVMLMSDLGGPPITDVDLTFDDGAAESLPSTFASSGTFKPTNHQAGDGPNDSFPGPAPAAPYGTALSVFNGTDPNGSWKLWVNDDAMDDIGSIYSFDLFIDTVPIPATADVTPPVFAGKPSANPPAFEVKKSGKAETPVSGAKKGTTFRYSLSEAAAVTFTIQRKLKGRKVGRKCKKPTRRNRHRRRCTRYKRAGAFRQQAVSGANSKSFSGRIGRRSLRPGRYRALLVATDAAGNKSKAAKVAFRVLKHKRRR
jgi:hypothetical protein